MSTKVQNHTYKLKRGSEDIVNEYNPVLLRGEPIVIYCNDGCTRLKIGDGVTALLDLPFVTSEPIEIDDVPTIDSKNLVRSDGVAKELTSIKSIINNDKSIGVRDVIIGDTKIERVDGNVIIPVATQDLSGIVKSSADTNSVSVQEDGKMEVNDINVNKIVQDSGDTLYLASGSSQF